MPEYIDREELIKRIELSINSWSRDCNSNAPAMVGAYKDILLRVKNIPAADVVETPCKCEKCIYTEIIVCPITGTKSLFCQYGTKPVAVDPTHYCSYSERKDGTAE